MHLLVRIYFFSWAWLDRTLEALRACAVGLWLGVLTRERLQAINEEYYTRTKRGVPGEPNYHSKEYNRRGLRDWEEQAVTDYFAGRKRLVVIGAGGGRIVLALKQLGYQVDAFESHPSLVAVANELLREEGYEPNVRLAPRDEAPNSGTAYDGIIIGWGAYMLVQGRRQRIDLLKQLRAQTRANSPIVLSFFYMPKISRTNKVSGFAANAIRLVLRRERVEVGDWLAPHPVHLFTQGEITSELSEGGFRIVHYGAVSGAAGYGHAIAIAI
jgi:hypothetical protein